MAPLILVGLLAVLSIGINYYFFHIRLGLRAALKAQTVYSSAQKDALYYLLMYSVTRNEHYWTTHRARMVIPVSESAARVALKNNDMKRAYEEFRSGGLRHRDTENIIWLFRYYQNAKNFDDAMRIWESADHATEMTQKLGTDLHEKIRNETIVTRDVQHASNILEQLNVVGERYDEAFVDLLMGEIHEINAMLLYVAIASTTGIGFCFYYFWSTSTTHLKRQERKYRTLVENTPCIIYQRRFSGDRRMLFVSPNVEAMLGYTPSDFLSSPDFLESTVLEKDRKPMTEALDALEANKSVATEFHLRKRNGDVIWLKNESRLVDDEDEGLIIEGILVDITERKRMDEKLREINQRLVLAIEGAGIGIFDWDAVEDRLYWNDKQCELMGTNLSVNNTSSLWYSVLHPEDIPDQNLLVEKLKNGSAEYRTDFRIVRPKDGRIRHIRALGLPTRDEDGKMTRLTGVNIDITRDIEYRETMERLLEEKDFLIREIHHRVKNNLQLMSSVLYLKARSIQDPAVKEVLHNSRDRLKSMAIIHERLMDSGNRQSRIEISEYVRELIRDLTALYMRRDKHVTFNFNLQKAFLPSEQVINCGFIINEAIANSLKHAFNGKESGNIEITFVSSGPGHLLEVKDDGTGFDPAAKNERQSFGMQLIRDFAAKIKGNATVDGTNGTKWTITFR